MLEKKFSKCQNLIGIFYSIFNEIKGRTNVAQYPDFFSKDLFDRVSNYVITKEEFANRIIVSDVNDMNVIGCLQFLVSGKYTRHKFMFNVCFVVRSDQPKSEHSSLTSTEGRTQENSDEDCSHPSLATYENMVRQMNRFFHALEHETGQLYEAQPEQMRDCLRHIYTELRSSGMCRYIWQSYGTIYLKVGHENCESLPVQREQVPLCSLAGGQVAPAKALRPLDLTSQRLLPLLDGYSTIAELARSSQIHLNVVRACVQDLGQAGLVTTVSQCVPEARYMALPHLRLLLTDPPLQSRLLIHLLGPDVHDSMDEHEINGTLKCVLQSLATLVPNGIVDHCAATLAGCCTYSRTNIDCCRLIQFAEAEGLIRRVQGFPLLGPGSGLTGLGGSGLARTVDADVLALMDGTHNVQEMFCSLDKPLPPLDLDSDDVYVMWK